MRRGERRVAQLPRPLLTGFVLMFFLQLICHHFNQSDAASSYRSLTRPYSAEVYRVLSIGSERLLSALLAVRIQLHDNQAGQHLRYNLMDYSILVEWLERISELDPGSEYPMLLASRIYTQTRDEQQLRQIIRYIEREFDTNPPLHWRRLAEVVVIARHQLDDLELALRLSEKIAAQPLGAIIPHWARDLQFLVLAELNELEAAITIIQAMLVSGSISDVDERHFLQEKLSSYQQKLSEFRHSERGSTNWSN